MSRRSLVKEVLDTNDYDRLLFRRTINHLKKSYYDKDLRSGTGEQGQGFSNRIRVRIGKAEKAAISFSEQGPLVSKRYKRGTGFGLPFSDNSMRSILLRTNKESLPDSVELPIKQDISTADGEAFAAYTGVSKRIRRDILPLFIAGAIGSAQAIGFCPETNGTSIKPLSISEAVDNIVKDTAEGYMDFRRKNDPKFISDAKDFLRTIFIRPNFNTFLTKNIAVAFNFKNVFSNKDIEIFDQLMLLPAAIYHRFQISVDVFLRNAVFKIRQVWCIPGYVVALESYFFGNILKKVKNHCMNSDRPSYSTGSNSARIRNTMVCRLILMQKNYPSLSIFCVDYKKFDRSINIIAFDVFFALAKSILDLSVNESKVFSFLRFYSKYTPFIYNNRLFFKKKGIASGSYITNIFDTWFNGSLWSMSDILITDYPDIAYKLSVGKLNLEDSEFDFSEQLRTTSRHRYDTVLNGDDTMICTSQFEIDVHKILCDYFGLSVSIKCIYKGSSGQIFFAGKFWDEKGRPYQSEMYMSSHIVFRTKFYKIGKDLTIEQFENLDLYRVLSICLQFKNGLQFLEKSFYDWEPYVKFKSEKVGYWKLADWLSTENEFITYSEAVNNSLFV